MSMAPSRIAAAGGMVIGGVPTVIRVRTSEMNLTYGIPLVAIARDTPAEDCSITIDWGDGTVKTYPIDSVRKYAFYFRPGDSEIVHTYALPGVYRVTVDGRATDIMLGSDANVAYKTYAGMVEAVEQWGPSVMLGSVVQRDINYLEPLARAGYVASFRACANLTYVAPVLFDRVCPYAIAGSTFTTLDGMTTDLTNIDPYALAGSAVTGATWWPLSQETVPEGCFYGAKSLTSLVGLESMTVADDVAFAECSALTSLDGLSSLELAGIECFADCTSLARFDKLDQYGVPMQSMALTTLGTGCFKGCTALTSLVSFPHLVTELPESCFEGCTGLKNIYIPGQVLTIRTHAFKNCGATHVAFYDPVILYGHSVVRAARYAAPTRIDQAAFIGQAGSGVFDAPGMTAEQLRAITGSLSYSGTIHDSTNPMSVSWSSYASGRLVESKDWFTCDNPTFAPWGLGKSWELVFSGSVSDQTTNHNSVICADFLTAPGDNAPPAVGGSTKLECMEAAVAYDSGGISYDVEPQFSPYGEERG